MKNISRKDFLKGVTFSAAGIAAASLLSGCSNQNDKNESCPIVECETNDWLGKAPEIKESDIVKTIDTEVLVIGAGSSGMFAATAAVEEGAKTILIEKYNEAFGGSGIRDTLAAIGSKQQIANNDNPDKQEVITELYKWSNGYGDTRLYKCWADNSGETVDWFTDILAEAGWNFKHEVDKVHEDARFKSFDVGHSLQLEGRPYDPNNSSRVLKEWGIEKGLEIHYETELVCLIKENDKVTGIYAKTTDGIVRYNASKGVIVATGGYSNNKEMLKALQPETLLYNNNNSSFPGSQGIGIKAMLWAGAKMDEVHASCVFDRGAIKPDAIGNENGYMFWMGSQPFLKVDLDGKRFTNESGAYDHILHDSTNLKGHTYAMVWDGNFVNDIERFDTHGCSRMFPHENGTEPVMPIEYIAYVCVPQAIEDGYVVSADTIEELAEKLNLPVNNFKATVDRYNELYDMQNDEDFGKEAYRLSSLRSAPFQGVRMSGGYFINTMDGVKINTDMQVLDENFEPIEGLYACGDCTGGYFATSYPNLLAGAAAGRSATFGRRAGKIVAKK